MLRIFLFAILSFILQLPAQSAQAEEFYRCEFSAVQKKPLWEPWVWTKVAYVGTHRSNTIDFGGDFKTKLVIQLNAKSDFEGSVNGQPGFILTGSASSGGTFESAAAKGTIKCEPKKDYPVAFVFLPWKAIFVQGDAAVFSSWEPGSRADYSCLIGDVNAARAIVAQGMKLSIDKVIANNVGGLDVIRSERECLKYEGSDPREDMTCVKYAEPKDVLYQMRGCDYNEDYDSRG